MDSKIGLIIQIAGVSLITLLTLFLRRSLKVVALKHWTHAWLFLSFALFCLRLAFAMKIRLFDTVVQLLYFLTEYILIFVGRCHAYFGENGDRLIRQRSCPFIVIAFSLPFVAAD